jgi:hypothetical protein
MKPGQWLLVVVWVNLEREVPKSAAGRLALQPRRLHAACHRQVSTPRQKQHPGVPAGHAAMPPIHSPHRAPVRAMAWAERHL